MKDMDSFYAGAEYFSPKRKINWLVRKLPSPFFYLKVFGIVWRASRLAKLGKYDSVGWNKSCAETARALEEAGCTFHVVGMQNLKNIKNPCVFICNHMSALETFVLPALILPHGIELSYVVKRSLVKYPIFKHIVNFYGPVIVDRVNPRDDFKVVMEDGAICLEQGRSLIIFPQHTRTVDFDAKQFNSIGVKLARKTGALVVPVALKTWAWPSGKIVKDFGPIYPERTIHFAFGEPLKINGKGQEEQSRIITFIEGHLNEWQDSA